MSGMRKQPSNNNSPSKQEEKGNDLLSLDVQPVKSEAPKEIDLLDL
jgi:hypothetical protein